MKQLAFPKTNVLLLCSLVFVASSCYYEGGSKNRIEGKGPTVTRTLDVENFDGISIQNSANVFLEQGKNFRVEVEGQENIIENLNTELTGSLWKIRGKRPVWRRHSLTIRITMPDIHKISIGGSGDVTMDSKFKDLGDLEFRVSGSGNMKLFVEADDIYGRIGGSGSIRLEGSADVVDFRISGSGDIYAMELKAEEADARISGAGTIRLHVEDRLDASISGSGDVYYKGNPRVSSSVSGSGNIHSR